MTPLPRTAGNRRISRQEAIQRTARLILADPSMGLDAAWRYVTGGWELGGWRKAIGLEVVDAMARLSFRPVVARAQEGGAK